MSDLKTIRVNTNYDKDLLKIKNFELHKELLPFIGYNYEKLKLLLVGESHYVGKDDFSNLEMVEMYKNWYEKPTKSNENAMEYKDWFTTRNVIRNFQCRNRGRAHTMFSNPGKVLMELLGDKCPTDSAAFSFVAFCNYFQRPNLKEGKSMELIYPEEEEITIKIFEEMLDIIKPDGVIFLSKKAYNSYIRCKSKDYPILIDYVHHPTSPWWYRDKGREKFLNIMEDFLPQELLQENLLDERIWLMRKLFAEMGKMAQAIGYDVKACPDHYIVDYYLKGRKADRLPYLKINNGSSDIKIEIDSRLYFWKNAKEWEYLALNNKMKNNKKQVETPNFRGPSQVYKDLFDVNFRKKFIRSSLDYINEVIN